MAGCKPWIISQKVCVLGVHRGDFSQGCEDPGGRMAPYSYLLYLEAASRQNIGKARARQGGRASFFWVLAQTRESESHKMAFGGEVFP